MICSLELEYIIIEYKDDLQFTPII